MRKLSFDKVSAVLQGVPAVIRGLVEENEALQEKLASFEKEARVRNLVQEMETKGIDREVPSEVKIASLMKESDHSLNVKAEAIKLAAPQMSLVSVDGSTVTVSEGKESPAEARFIASLMTE